MGESICCSDITKFEVVLFTSQSRKTEFENKSSLILV